MTVTALDLTGCGVATLSGHPVLIENALPGETVAIELIQTARELPQPRKARARCLSLLATPFPDRLTPTPSTDCNPHFESCPGAPWLPVPPATQIAWKQALAAQTLDLARARLEPALQHRLPPTALQPLIPSPQWTGYRNKAEFTCGYNRIERIPDPRHPASGRTIPEGFDPAVGFHRTGAWQTVHGFDHCPILPPFMHDIRRRLDELCRTSTAIDNYRPWCDIGCRRTVMLRGGEGFDGRQLLLAIKTGGDPARERLALDELQTALSDITDLNLHWTCIEEGSHPRGHEPVGLLRGNPWITARFCGLQLRLRPASFFQTNLPAAERLIARLRQALQEEPPHTILDLYCGVGTLGLALGSLAERIVGIESVPAAVEDARENARLNGHANAEYTAAATEKSLGELLIGSLQADLPRSIALVDPPRAGLHPKALKLLLRAPLHRLAYVACNPVALANDLPVLATAGFQLESLTPFDFFPHTPHLEQLALLRRQP